LTGFGFLASKEVKEAGVSNLGIKDRKFGLFQGGMSVDVHYIHIERLALRWIQKYIGAFGGDPTKVTMYDYDLNSPILSRLSLFFSMLAGENQLERCLSVYTWLQTTEIQKDCSVQDSCNRDHPGLWETSRTDKNTMMTW